MSYTLEQLTSDIRTALKQNAGPVGREAVCALVSKALLDKEFIAAHVTEDACKPRKVLYEDPELGFCVCGHVYTKPMNGGPHDHGSSWAIYGIAEGRTEMTDWKVVQPAAGDAPKLVAPERVYVMQPGDAHFYDVGVVHSPKTAGLTRLVRVEGANLDHIKRSNIKAA